MDYSNILKDLLRFSELLKENILLKTQEADEIIKQIIIKDKNKEDTSDLVNQHRFIISSYSLLDRDLSKSISEISVYYSILKGRDEDLDFSKQEINNLDFILANSSKLFVLDKNKIKPKDSSLSKNINKTINKGNYDSTDFINKLRSSPIYKNNG